MKFALAKEHIDFFTKQGFIQFDQLFKLPAIEEYKANFDQCLSLRVKTPSKFLNSVDPELLFSEGRDVWRDSSKLETLFRSLNVCEIAKELFQQRSLRLAFTQYLPYYSIMVRDPVRDSKYLKFIDLNPTLQQISPIQGVVGGLIICLSHEGEDGTGNFLPQKAGSGVFFGPNCPMDFASLKMQAGDNYILIAFAIPNSVFVNNNLDPNLHVLKKYGYNIGDKLQDKLNPILCR